MEFIQWSKDTRRAGRADVVPGLVRWWPTLKITDLDPLEFDPLFERFLEPERAPMPDFDVGLLAWRNATSD